ncbi:hypothetical protein [Acinetobacter pittii]|uniref:hypothetical protein n=1 Tax=Acinetobacter pittii TaxID=48296 RepID=UPI000A356F1F|nr:hypothetical protein [Acinetobacter pittii]OTS52439.1 hypothetical protein CAT00_12330 [Acinetobacter pittii]
MTNLITANEAFAALQKGKTVLCRPAGDMLDFADLDQFPASVFGKPGFEFCIKIDVIELAGITFTKPMTIDEYVEGQDVFVINAYPALIYVLDFKTNALIESINSGFVQRDAENAKLQLNAFSKALGFEINNDLSVIRLGEGPKKQRGKKSKTEQPQVIEKPSVDPQLLEAEKDIVLDGINQSKTEPEINSLCYDLEKHSFTPEQLKAIENAKDAKLAELALIKAEAESEKHELFDTDEDQAPELSVLCEAFIDEIANSNSKEDLDFIRSRINSNGVLTEVENAELCTRINIKAKTFEKTDEDKSNYQEKLAELKKHVDEAKTPVEVNAAVKYTNSWSAEQRAPLLKHMHERLEYLKKEKQASEPSMFVKIQTAPDLTTLDSLEIDVSSLDPVVQPDMLKAVKARRDFLEHKAIDESSIDGDLP